LVPAPLRRAAAGLALRSSRRTTREKAMDLVSRPATTLELALASRRAFSDREINSLGFSPGSLGLSSDFLAPAAYEPFSNTGGDAFRTISQVECFLYMSNTLLRDSDCYSMAHSLELRVPFLGRGVSERATSLPGPMQAPPRSPNKQLLRKVVSDLLPSEVFNRPKRGFTLPIGEWMAGPLRDECEAAVSFLDGCPGIESSGVRALWGEYCTHWNQVHWSRPMTLVVLGSYLRNAR
jgi:asparagine synthase (glutamine-hydrolysing)